MIEMTNLIIRISRRNNMMECYIQKVAELVEHNKNDVLLLEKIRVGDTE